MFTMGCSFSLADIIFSSFKLLNKSVGLSSLSMVSNTAKITFYWLNKKTNALARVNDIFEV